MKNLDWLSIAVGGGLLVAAALLATACRDAVYPSPEQIYTAELRACVDAAHRVEEADACQRAVTRAHFPASDGGLLQ